MAKLVIVRHGQSIWNLENLFSGWADIPLSKKGILEAKKAGKLLKDYKFKIVFTSELLRAQQTLLEILNINNNQNKFFKIHDIQGEKYSRFLKKHKLKDYSVVFVSDKLNERDYGDLEGLNKEEMSKKYGKEKVHTWRRSFDVKPPGKYGESLKDTYERTIPYYKKNIEKELKLGNDVLVVAHGNSLRSIVKYIEKISNTDIPSFELKTGAPREYIFDKNLKVKSIKEIK